MARRTLTLKFDSEQSSTKRHTGPIHWTPSSTAIQYVVLAHRSLPLRVFAQYVVIPFFVDSARCHRFRGGRASAGLRVRQGRMEPRRFCWWISASGGSPLLTRSWKAPIDISAAHGATNTKEIIVRQGLFKCPLQRFSHATCVNTINHVAYHT